MIVILKDKETLEQAIERTIRERAKIDFEYRKPKTINERFLWVDGFVRIIVDRLDIEKFKCYERVYIADEQKGLLSFSDLLKDFKIKPHSYETIYVWIETGMAGEMWKCNYDSKKSMFYFHGETKGYA